MSGSQITPTAEFGQGTKRRSPAGVLIAERLLRSNPAIGLAILGFAKHLFGGLFYLTVGTTGFRVLKRQVHKLRLRRNLDKDRFLLLQNLHICHPWQSAQRRSPAGVLIPKRLLRSNPTIGLAILSFAKHLKDGLFYLTAGTTGFRGLKRQAHKNINNNSCGTQAPSWGRLPQQYAYWSKALSNNVSEQILKISGTSHVRPKKSAPTLWNNIKRTLYRFTRHCLIPLRTWFTH